MAINYPLGRSDFATIRTRGKLYVDKTELIYKLVTEGDYYFLSRPRRFGKSLLISTLEAYFKGKRELFAGLAIERREREWMEYPVLHLDLSGEDYTQPEALGVSLDTALRGWEKQYGAGPGEETAAARFRGVIARAREKTGRQAVVLVDEYDKPLFDTFNNHELYEANASALRGFYEVIKRMDADLRFAFLTGVTRFAHLNVFSGLNNLVDISQAEDYVALCGITERELRSDLMEGVAQLAERRGLTLSEALAQLKEKYDGYRFSPDSEESVYNPFSLFWALYERNFGEYWYESGTPLPLFRLLERQRMALVNLENCRMSASSLRQRNAGGADLLPLLYQTGYLTLAGYDSGTNEFMLRFPNQEVRTAFYEDLVQHFFRADAVQGHSIPRMLERMEAGRVTEFMEMLYAFIAGFNYSIAGDAEVYFQNLMVIIFNAMGLQVRAKLATSDGRIDTVVEMPSYIYLFEFKLDRPAAEAIAQIGSKRYAAPFSADNREVVLLGVSFNSRTRNMEECIARRAGQDEIVMKALAGRWEIVR